MSKAISSKISKLVPRLNKGNIQQSSASKSVEIQALLDLTPAKHREIDGVGMGIFTDGTPYLTARGLARMCGIDHSIVLDISLGWQAEQFRPRGKRIADILHEQGHDGGILQRRVIYDGVETHAYCDAVCMAFLEYYAFDAGLNTRPEAQRNYRVLARSSFRSYVYKRLGYNPQQNNGNEWAKLQDRMLLNFNNLPAGYYGIFRELADFLFFMVQRGVSVDEHTVPDISVGRAWSDYWKANSLEKIHGARLRHPHKYPDYFPQSKAGFDPEAWIYPDASLGEYRKWMREDYTPTKFTPYIQKKVKTGSLSSTRAESLINAVAGHTLTSIEKLGHKLQKTTLSIQD